MINWIKENKWKIIIVVAVYLVVCVCLLGGLMTSYQFADESLSFLERLGVATESWITYALNPFKVIDTMFDGGELQQTYLILCGGLLIFFIWMSVKLIMNSRKDHDYQGEEHGSSAWSKGGEEYRKLPDGSQILNKTDGFILSRNHYLGTDPKKVKVNKNILVFGGSGSGKSAAYVKPNILQKLGSFKH